MERLDEEQYRVALKRIELENLYKERNLRLKEEKNRLKPKIKLPSTSKLMAAYLFVVLNIMLIYAMIAMWHFMDLSYLGVLITDVAGQVITYFVYASKSKAENTKNGITYELALLEKQKEIQAMNGENAVG